LPGHSKLGTAANKRYSNFTVFSDTDILGHSAATDFFYHFWRSLPNPSRKDINPAKLTKYLDRIVIMDVHSDDDGFALNARLVGTFVANYYGEISGKDVRTMPNKEAAERIYSTSKMVLEQQNLLLTITPGISEDKKYLEAVTLYMPLFDDGGVIEKIMVCVDVASINRQK